MLRWVCFLDISFSHLLHHEVAINLNVLPQRAIHDAPPSGDGENTNWRSCVDEAVDPIIRVCESKFIRSLLVLLDTVVCITVLDTATYLALGLPICDRIHCRRSWISGLELIGNESWAERLDHQVMVVEGCKDICDGKTCRNWGCDTCGSHIKLLLIMN